MISFFNKYWKVTLFETAIWFQVACLLSLMWTTFEVATGKSLFFIWGFFAYMIVLILINRSQFLMITNRSKKMNRMSREDVRKFFSDPNFNKWLDEGISDGGHTAFD